MHNVESLFVSPLDYCCYVIVILFILLLISEVWRFVWEYQKSQTFFCLSLLKWDGINVLERTYSLKFDLREKREGEWKEINKIFKLYK